MAKPQPVPPAGRSPKGPGDQGRTPKDDAKLQEKLQEKREQNIEQQGDRANVKQNTTPQIRQPDR